MVGRNLKRLCLVLVLILSFALTGLLAVPLHAETTTPLSDDVTPTAGSVYSISDAAQLHRLSEIVTSGNNCSGVTFRLTTDIDLNPGITFFSDGSYSGGTPAVFSPIGTAQTSFRGVFEGQNHTIRGVYITNSTQSSIGLFGEAAGATISGVTLTNGYISGNGTVGGICGTAAVNVASDASTQIINCTNRAYVCGSGTMTGGVCGELTGKSTIVSCANETAVLSTYTAAGGSEGIGVGGICGAITKENANPSIQKSYNLAPVTAENCGNVGGVVGFSYAPLSLCYNGGSVVGAGHVGGVVGMAYLGDVENVYNLGSVSGATFVGGVVGHASGNLSSVYNIGEVTGETSDGIAWYLAGVATAAYSTTTTACGVQKGFSELASTTALPDGFSGSVWLLQDTTAAYCYPALIDVINPDLSADDEGALLNAILSNATGELPSAESNDVTASYRPSSAASTIYSIDILWGSLDFVYTEGSHGVWNPETHSYDGVTEGSWSCEEGANAITVINHSNTALVAHFTYTPGDAAIAGAFDRTTAALASAVGTTVDQAPQETAKLTLSGELDADTDEQSVIGKVTVSFVEGN